MNVRKRNTSKGNKQTQNLHFLFVHPLECVIYHLHVFKWNQRFSVAEFMDVYFQMLFSEGTGMVGVNLRGKKKDLESSKVGGFGASNLIRLQSRT